MAERAGSHVTLVSGNISSWKYSSYITGEEYFYLQTTHVAGVLCSLQKCSIHYLYSTRVQLENKFSVVIPVLTTEVLVLGGQVQYLSYKAFMMFHNSVLSNISYLGREQSHA